MRPASASGSIPGAAVTSTALITRRDGGAIEDGFSLDEHIRLIQREFIERAMAQAGKNKTAAARLLGYASYQRLDATRERLGM